MGLTSDPKDPRLGRGVDDERQEGQNEVYLVLPTEERHNFVRPVYTRYLHEACGKVTKMGIELAETYAKIPDFYGATWCATCHKHLPVGPDGEFVWVDENGNITDKKVGT